MSIRSLLASVAALALTCGAACAQTGGQVGPISAPATCVAPAPAQQAGYCTLTFNAMANFSASTIDLAGNYASGFSWYQYNFGGTTPTAANITPQADGSVILGAGGDTFGGNIASAGHIASSPNYVGTAFGGGGYFEVTLKFTPGSGSIATGWPAAWTYSLGLLLGTAQWSGQAAGYEYGAEEDIFENFLGNNSQPLSTYNATTNAWYGIFGTTNCPPVGGYCLTKTSTPIPVTTNFAVYHRYGLLWVQATATKVGAICYYFDGAQVHCDPYTQFTTQTPAPAPPWQFGIVDGQHLVFILGSGAAAPMQVQSVGVWQASAASNLHN